MGADASILSRLMAVIEDRAARRPSGSYTVQLLEGGREAIGAKVLEEAGEVVEASGEGEDRRGPRVAAEAADLVYHLLVLLAHAGVSLSDVEAELARRFGLSGLEEKANRPPKA